MHKIRLWFFTKKFMKTFIFVEIIFFNHYTDMEFTKFLQKAEFSSTWFIFEATTNSHFSSNEDFNRKN